MNNNKQLKCFNPYESCHLCMVHFSDEIKGNFIHLQFCCVWMPSSNILWLNCDERENMFAIVVHTNKLIKQDFQQLKAHKILLVFESSKCPLANIFASKHFSCKKLRVKWKCSCMHTLNTMRKRRWFHIALTGHQTYANFFCTFVLYWVRDVLCATFSGFCFKVYYNLAFYDTLNLSDKK